MEDRFTARNESLFVGPYEHYQRRGGLLRSCRLCLETPGPAQPVMTLRPKAGNAIQIETLGLQGALYHVDCLRRAATVTTTCCYTRHSTTSTGGPPALVLNRNEEGDLDYEAFGSFVDGIRLEYARKGCIWCKGHGEAPGVVLNFPVPDIGQRFRVLHIPCIEEIWANEQPRNWRERPAPDPEDMLRSFAELLQLT